MTTPVRLELSRKKGFDLQGLSRAVNGLGARRVDRTTNFGNPYKNADPDLLVRLFRDGVRNGEGRFAWIVSNAHELRGKNLACWCKLGDPCHADVLLEIANRPVCEAAPSPSPPVQDGTK